MAVDTLGYLIELTVTPANEQERSQVQQLCEAVQRATGETVEVAWGDQGYTGKQAKDAAAAAGIVERSFALLARFRRLSRDFERLPQVLASLHFVVFAMLMLPKAVAILGVGKVHNTL